MVGYWVWGGTWAYKMELLGWCQGQKQIKEKKVETYRTAEQKNKILQNKKKNTYMISQQLTY